MRGTESMREEMKGERRGQSSPINDLVVVEKLQAENNAGSIEPRDEERCVRSGQAPRGKQRRLQAQNHAHGTGLAEDVGVDVHH